MEPDRDHNVVPFKRAPGLHRNEAIVLSLYRTRRQALAPADREQLAIVEALLFQDGLDAARKAIAAYPADVRFDSDRGSIYHAYCPVRACFTLCDFELPPRGGGREGDIRGAVSHCVNRLAAGLRGSRAFAASMFASINQVAMHSMHLAAVVGLDRLLDPFLMRGRHGIRGGADPLDLSPIFYTGDGHGSWRFVAAHAADWSLLGSMATVDQELESSFSRSILRGEYLCHIGHAVDTTRRPSTNKQWRAILDRVERRRFYRECSLLLSALSEGRRDTGRASMFLTGDFAMNDLAADERLLSLVSSEIVMRVSSSVYLDSSLTSYLLTEDKSIVEERNRTAVVFRRFALVAELAKLLARRFDGPAPSEVAVGVVSDYSRGRDRRYLETVVHRIAGYDRWLEDVQICCSEEIDEAPVIHHDASPRLRELLGELLTMDNFPNNPA